MLGDDVFKFQAPQNANESITFANANGVEWGYYFTCRDNGVTPVRVPDGWALAWLEYNRRATTFRMEILSAFPLWRDTGTLPGLDGSGVA